MSFPRTLRGFAGHVRLTVSLCLVLICGSFASAAMIQMRLDRAHALSQAALFGERRAEEMATDLGQTLDRYRAIGAAFASAGTSAETSAALSEAGGAALDNISVLDRDGRPVSDMKNAPGGILPLAPGAIAEARRGHAIAVSRNGRTIALLFAHVGRIVAVEFDPRTFLSPAGMKDGLLASASGQLVALGSGWREAPSPAALALDHARSAARIVESPTGSRLISLQRVEGWPLSVASSVRVEDALGAWYGALPLYFFFIVGPALAGAALAVLFVRVFEKQAKAWAAIKALRSTRPGEARLLVRLADAERRAAEAERAKTRFVSQVSHELRTPLNAVIGFAEAIESGVFGAPGHPKYAEYAHDIGAAGRELHAKIGSVLEYAAVAQPFELPKPCSALQTIDAAAVARAKLEEWAGAARAHGVKLVVSLPDTGFAQADEVLLARILRHLLDNAFAYTPKGGTVRLTMRSDARSLVIGVRDTGLGFSAGERARAGQPFLRFPRTGSPGGMGLGLATALGLARRMGTTIDLSSVPGEGTLAELRLSAPAP